MSLTIPINRKIKGAAIATLIVLIGEIANQALSLYPHNPFVNELPIILPAITGWLVKEENADEDISSQIEVEPTPVEWAQPTAPASPVVAETVAPAPVSTPVALPNADVPVATPIVENSVPAQVSIDLGPEVPAVAVIDPKTGLVEHA